MTKVLSLGVFYVRSFYKLTVGPPGLSIYFHCFHGPSGPCY